MQPAAQAQQPRPPSPLPRPHMARRPELLPANPSAQEDTAYNRGVGLQPQRSFREEELLDRRRLNDGGTHRAAASDVSAPAERGSYRRGPLPLPTTLVEDRRFETDQWQAPHVTAISSFARGSAATSAAVQVADRASSTRSAELQSLYRNWEARLEEREGRLALAERSLAEYEEGLLQREARISEAQAKAVAVEANLAQKEHRFTDAQARAEAEWAQRETRFADAQARVEADWAQREARLTAAEAALAVRVETQAAREADAAAAAAAALRREDEYAQAVAEHQDRITQAQRVLDGASDVEAREAACNAEAQRLAEVEADLQRLHAQVRQGGVMLAGLRHTC